MTGAEIESYQDCLEKNGFKYETVIGRSKFSRFVDDCKDRLSIEFIMAADWVR